MRKHPGVTKKAALAGETIIMDNAIFQNLLDDEINNFESKLDLDIAEKLKLAQLTLSVAESITGGMLSQRISSLAGSSEYFRGGIIAYHNTQKISLLSVKPETIRKYTVISEQVALEMVRGLKKLIRTDLCIATTGIAGPANEEFFGNIIGRVYIAFIVKNVERVKSFHFTGTRDAIRKQTTAVALNYLKIYLQHHKI